MELFEALLAQVQVSIERFVRFRIDSPADAEDILQETYLTAYQKFSQLRNPDAFKAWVLSIARNKCTDYFRQKALRQETSFEALAESADSRYGASDSASVRETFDTLREKDRQILHWNCEKQTFHSETEFQKAISIYFHGKGRSSIHEKISRFSPRIYHCGQRRTAFRSPLGGTGRVVPDSQIGRKMLLGYV